MQKPKREQTAKQLANLKKFQKGNNANPNGRPPKLLKDITAELKTKGFERVGPSHIAEAYELLFNMSESKIKEIVVGKDYPMLLQVVAREMLSGKGVQMLELMMDRVHGRSRQQVEIKQVEEVQTMDLSKLNKEELDVYYELTKKITN